MVCFLFIGCGPRYTADRMNAFQIRRLKEEAPPSSFTKAVRWIRRVRLPAAFLFWRVKEVVKEKKEAKRRSALVKKILVIAVIVAACTGGVAVGVKALVDMNVIQVTQIMEVAGTPLPTDEYGHTNFLLLGQGDEAHDGVDLTDTIILASLDARNRSAAMISIPRDLYLRTERMGAGRINALYRDFKYSLIHDGMDKEEAGRAAMQELATELSNFFGIKLHHVVKVDFIGFVQAVDAVGGIDIDVPEDLYDPEYPGPNYTYQTFSVLEGHQHFDGETALKYARSRHSTSDFDRSRRQQDILQALADKGRSDGVLTSPSRITSLLRIMDQHVATTLTFREMVTLAKLGASIDRSKIVSVQFNLEGPGGFLYPPPRDQFGGAAVLIPNSWNEVRTFMNLILTQRPLFLDEQSIDVYNAGGPSGAAGLLARELDRYTLHVGEVANYDGDDRPTSAILAPESRKQTAETLGTLLGIADIATLPSTSTGTSVQILLGEDYHYVPIGDLAAKDDAADNP